jgi:hypothetical protein
MLLNAAASSKDRENQRRTPDDSEACQLRTLWCEDGWIRGSPASTRAAQPALMRLRLRHIRIDGNDQSLVESLLFAHFQDTDVE